MEDILDTKHAVAGDISIWSTNATCDIRPIFAQSDDDATSCMFGSCYHALTYIYQVIYNNDD